MSYAVEMEAVTLAQVDEVESLPIRCETFDPSNSVLYTVSSRRQRKSQLLKYVKTRMIQTRLKVAGNNFWLNHNDPA